MKNEPRRGRDYKKFTVAFKMKIIDEIENGILTKRDAWKLGTPSSLKAKERMPSRMLTLPVKPSTSSHKIL
jgi:hypothetical protein